MSALVKLEEGISYRFTADDQRWMWNVAQQRSDDALEAIRKGWMTPKYAANGPAGHMTGIAGEWVVQDALKGGVGVQCDYQRDGWDLIAAGVRIEVKSWPINYVGAAGHGLNERSLFSIASRQKAQGLGGSVIAMCGVQKDAQGTPEVAWWYGWSSTNDLVATGQKHVVNVHGNLQTLRVLPWNKWWRPSLLFSTMTTGDTW